MYEGRRAQSPFDDSAADRLRRMGLTDENGNPDRDAIAVCGCVFAGQFFDDLCDYFESYRDFYELREKNRIVIRIIFTVQPDGEVLLLHAFQKRQPRDTMQALERSLKLLSSLRDHPEYAVEYIIEEEHR